KIIAVPIELLMDSQIDVEAFVRGRMQTRIGRITNQHFTTGTGTGQPRGVVTGSGAGKVGTTGQTTTVIYDDLVDLQESVDIAYQNGNERFMFRQSMRAVVRKLKDGSSRPIWTPNYDLGASAGSPDLLLGTPVVINNDMPAPAANAKSIVFGDLSKYIIRDVMQVSMFRFTDSVYTSKGQVGFLAWMRAGGNLTDTAAVKHYQHSAT
nr:phage major capsid protein [Nitrosomonas sp.]